MHQSPERVERARRPDRPLLCDPAGGRAEHQAQSLGEAYFEAGGRVSGTW